MGSDTQPDSEVPETVQPDYREIESGLTVCMHVGGHNAGRQDPSRVTDSYNLGRTAYLR